MPSNSHHQEKPLWNDSWTRTFPMEGNQEFAQLLKWLKQATPEQMYERLKEVKDLRPALTICDHILYATERQGPFAALACFAKAKLSKGQRNIKDNYRRCWYQKCSTADSNNISETSKDNMPNRTSYRQTKHRAASSATTTLPTS